jgi:hypothetical protein
MIIWHYFQIQKEKYGKIHLRKRKKEKRKGREEKVVLEVKRKRESE